MSVGEPPLSVGFVLVAESGGGAAVAIERLIDLLGESSAKIHALGNDLPWMASKNVGEGLKLVLPDATPGSLRSGLSAFRGMRSLIDTMSAIRRHCRKFPDLVLLPFLTGTALVTLAATIGLPNPVIVCERNDPSRQRHGWHVETMKRVLYPRAAAITLNAPHQSARDHLVRVSRRRPVVYLPNPRPSGMPSPDVRSSRVILSVGRLVPQKHHATLIEAFAAISPKLSGWKLRIVGGGPLLADLSELVQRLNIGRSVELVHRTNDVRQHYASASVFVLASSYEGTSNALLEAASAGLPCIVSRETTPLGASSALLTVPAGSQAALADCLLDVCTNGELRVFLGSEARRWVNLVTNEEVSIAWLSAIQMACPPSPREEPFDWTNGVNRSPT